MKLKLVGKVLGHIRESGTTLLDGETPTFLDALKSVALKWEVVATSCST
jgi:hypothetical protein